MKGKSIILAGGSGGLGNALADALAERGATPVLGCKSNRARAEDLSRKLYDKYGIIIGHVQAGEFIQQGLADKRDFEENAYRLEERLASMGLLKRLSDACAGAM